jgi:hypothetical protein
VFIALNDTLPVPLSVEEATVSPSFNLCKQDDQLSIKRLGILFDNSLAGEVPIVPVFG